MDQADRDRLVTLKETQKKVHHAEGGSRAPGGNPEARETAIAGLAEQGR